MTNSLSLSLSLHLQSGRDEEYNSEQLQAQMRGSFRRNVVQS